MSDRHIDPDDPEFQLGRFLHDAQVLYADAEKGPVDPDRVKQVCERYCRLINLVGYLRCECQRLERKVDQAADAIKDALRQLEGK